MDALVPAFVAALLAGIADRPARLAALLAARGRYAAVLAGMTIGHTVAIAIAVVGAVAIAPLMTPEAKALLLAFALILTGATTFAHHAAPRAATDRTFVPAATGAFVAGDATAFLAFAIAVRSAAPVLAGAGALAGAVTLAGIAAAIGTDWAKLPLRRLGRIAGALLLVTGLIVLVAALRLT